MGKLKSGKIREAVIPNMQYHVKSLDDNGAIYNEPCCSTDKYFWMAVQRTG